MSFFGRTTVRTKDKTVCISSAALERLKLIQIALEQAKMYTLAKELENIINEA